MAKKETELVIRPLGDRLLVRRDEAEKYTRPARTIGLTDKGKSNGKDSCG